MSSFHFFWLSLGSSCRSRLQSGPPYSCSLFVIHLLFPGSRRRRPVTSHDSCVHQLCVRTKLTSFFSSDPPSLSARGQRGYPLATWVILSSTRLSRPGDLGGPLPSSSSSLYRQVPLVFMCTHVTGIEDSRSGEVEAYVEVGPFLAAVGGKLMPIKL